MAPALPGHRLQLLQGGEAFFPALVAAIDASRRDVRMETYIFSTEGAGSRVAQALERAARRGVSVSVVIDGVGTPALQAAWAQRWREAGVAWRIFLPWGRIGLLVPSRWRRLHRKLCVVDGEVAFCGGINVLDDHFDPNHGRLAAPRLDFSVRVTGPLVHDAYAEMMRFWWRLEAVHPTGDPHLLGQWHALQQAVRSAWPLDSLRPPASATGSPTGAQAALVLRDNLRHRARIEQAYLAAIRLASREIIIANAYFLPGRRLRRALIAAARRGVRVRLLLQGRYEYFMQYHAARPVYGRLLAAGVEIHEYRSSFLHAKVAVVDAHWATVGSSNLDPLSLLLAREANVVVRDGHFASELRERLVQAMAQGGEPVDPAVYASRPLRERLLDRIAFGLMRLGLFLTGKRY